MLTSLYNANMIIYQLKTSEGAFHIRTKTEALRTCRKVLAHKNALNESDTVQLWSLTVGNGHPRKQQVVDLLNNKGTYELMWERRTSKG